MKVHSANAMNGVTGRLAMSLIKRSRFRAGDPDPVAITRWSKQADEKRARFLAAKEARRAKKAAKAG